MQLMENNASEQTEGLDLQVLKAMTVTLSKAIEVLERGDHEALDSGTNFYEEVERFEISLIQRALRQTAGNQARAARLLGLNQTTLHGKIKHYGIKPEIVFYNGKEAHHENANVDSNQLRSHIAG